MAAFLAQSWRHDLPELNFTESDLDEVTPLLYGSGAAALGWKRISNSHLRETASAELLHQAYRLHSLQAAMHEQKIARLFGLLSQAGVDAVLAKGWAAASLYPDTSLRPYGDVDICVRREHFDTTQQILSTPEARDCFVDLHRHFVELKEWSFDKIFARSRVVDLNGQPIRVLGDEDHLALLCIHLLRHGAWRPIWLCDVGAAIESLKPDFDWDICFGRSTTRANWVATACTLAQELLSADGRHLPSKTSSELPAWLVDNVLMQWSHPFAADQPPNVHPIPMHDLLRQPSHLFEGLRNRWPNAIIATITVNGRFNRTPRLPYQLASCLTRARDVLIPRRA